MTYEGRQSEKNFCLGLDIWVFQIMEAAVFPSGIFVDLLVEPLLQSQSNTSRQGWRAPILLSAGCKLNPNRTTRSTSPETRCASDVRAKGVSPPPRGINRLPIDRLGTGSRGSLFKRKIKKGGGLVDPMRRPFLFGVTPFHAYF